LVSIRRVIARHGYSTSAAPSGWVVTRFCANLRPEGLQLMIVKAIECKSILTRSGIVAVDYAANPYVGCGHACAYCYAGFMKRFTGHKEEWGAFVDVKVNAAGVLARQLRRARPANVTFGTVTDAYQPLEAVHRVTRAGVDWLLAGQRENGMWHCRANNRYNCLRATLDTLRVAALDPETAAHPAIARGAAAVCELLMEPRTRSVLWMSRYHVGLEWTTLQYPYFDYSLISALDALARLGYTTEYPKIARALEYLQSRQLPDGTWSLDQHPRPLPFDLGEPGQPNKWVTLDALRTIRLLT